MPTYEFRCADGTIIERIFKMSEAPDAIPAPDGGMAVRIISGGADLIFKGSGFYITDYGKDGKKDERAKNEERRSKNDAQSAGKTDTKTESKAEPAKDVKSEPSSADKTPKAEKSSPDSAAKSDKSGAKPDKPSPPSGAAA